EVAFAARGQAQLLRVDIAVDAGSISGDTRNNVRTAGGDQGGQWCEIAIRAGEVRFAIVIGGNRRECQGIEIVLQRQGRDRALQFYEVVIDAVRDLAGKAGARRLDGKAARILTVVVFRILVGQREVGRELIGRLGGNRE